MEKLQYLTIVACIGSMLLFTACTSSVSGASLPEYFSPLPNAEYVSTGETIAIRYGPTLNAQNLASLKIDVQGSKSGPHTGRIILAEDQRTVIFKPDQRFTPAEKVKVAITSLQVGPTTYHPLSYTFQVAANQQPGSVATASGPATTAPKSAFPNFLTLPQDIPHYTVTKVSPNLGEGFIFVAPFYWTKSTLGSYLLILNDQGQLVYYKSVADGLSAFDFKVQPDGMLSYFNQKNSTFYVLNSHYQVFNTYQAGNGYVTDLHDLQLLPNGNALLMAYDNETVDMSKVVQGGQKAATVTGLVVQELDPAKNVILEWRSWDHFSFTDSTADLTAKNIDLVHGNALAMANDGNLLLSSRNLSEITKINLRTGDIIWRMGGKANMFDFADSQLYAFQHDVRQLPNGDITVFDNQGTQDKPAPSLGIEYKIDETKKTATEVWNFAHLPSVFGTFMGDTQRLADGNTFLDWGAPSQAAGYSYISMTEVAPDGGILFELSFDQPYVSYRAFRFPWQGFPDTLPTLASKVDAKGITLGYSWNGATEVAQYQIYGGTSPQSLTLIEQKPTTDFETQSHYSGLPKNECYFQVVPLDKSGNAMAHSKLISTDPLTCPLAP